MHDYTLHTFPSGIRLVHVQMPNSAVSHSCIMINTGSRDEDENELGMTHFWEHMAFKGTKKRKAFHILSRLDSLGGELNAFTTKEKLCFHASILNEHVEKSIELLCDITFHSVFPEKEIEKEKGVILEEMAMYEDSPEDAIADDFEAQVFSGHSLSGNILGTRDRVSCFTQKDFQNYRLNKGIKSDNVVIVSFNNLSFSKTLKLVEKQVLDIQVSTERLRRQAFTNYLPKKVTIEKPIQQSHFMMGNLAFGLNDNRRMPLFLLNNILGGPGMNSRLNLAIREKFGFVYHIDSSVGSFEDIGLFSVYFGTDKKYVDKVERLIYKELNYFIKAPITDTLLYRSKEQVVGQLAMSEENRSSLMLYMAKSILDKGEIESFESVVKRVRDISAQEIKEVAEVVFDLEGMSVLRFLGVGN